MSDWHKIANAPKKESILVTGGTYTWDCDYPDTLPLKHVALVHWFDGRWRGESTGYQDEYFWYQPTHWQPLPEPLVHDSDCALHNEPATPNGPCDCSLSRI